MSTIEMSTMEMSTIEVSKSKSKSVKKLTKKSVCEMIEECGRMYNFDGKEALIKLNLEKEKVKKEKKEKMLLPFNGKKNEGCCNGIVKNHGLYTQCVKKVDGYCKSCESQPYGNIEDRVKVGLYEYKDPKGKSPKRYLEVLNKKKISKDEIMAWLGRENMEIAESHLLECVEKVKRGRPKSEKKVKEHTGKKGRPKKEKKVVELPNEEDDLFANLVAQAQAQVQAEVEAEVEVEVQAEVQSEVQSEVQAQVQAKEIVKEVAKEVVKKVKEVKPKKEKGEATAKKGRPKKEKKTVEVSSSVTPGPSIVVEEEQEADVVKKIEFEGKFYYKSKKSGIIYNMDQDVVGKWDEETERINFEEEETEDDYEE
jgi:hypothetical protein